MRNSALSVTNTKRKCELFSLKNKPRKWTKCDDALKAVLGNVRAVRKRAGQVNVQAAEARVVLEKKGAKPLFEYGTP